MQITVEMPDEIAQRLNQPEGNLSRRILETFVADAYRCGEISTAEVGQMLQLSSRLEIHTFLKPMGVYLNSDQTELERDLQTLKKLRAE